MRRNLISPQFFDIMNVNSFLSWFLVSCVYSIIVLIILIIINFILFLYFRRLINKTFFVIKDILKGKKLINSEVRCGDE